MRDKVEEKGTRIHIMTFTIDLCIQNSGKYFGLCMVDIKSPMTYDTLSNLSHLVHNRLQSLIHHRQEGQEGQEEGECNMFRFREETYSMIRGCVDDVAQFFGEDAVVYMDLNLDYHRSRAMTSLYQKDLTLMLGRMQEEGWMVRPFVEDRLDDVMGLFV